MVLIIAALAAAAISSIVGEIGRERAGRHARQANDRAEARAEDRIRQALTDTLNRLQDDRFKLDTSQLESATDRAQDLQDETLDFVRSQRGLFDDLTDRLRQIAIAQTSTARSIGLQRARASGGGRGRAFGTSLAGLSGQVGATAQAGLGANLLSAEVQGTTAQAQHGVQLAGLQTQLIGQQQNIARLRALPLTFQQFSLAPQQQAILNSQQALGGIGMQGLVGQQNINQQSFAAQNQLLNNLTQQLIAGSGSNTRSTSTNTTTPGVTS